MDSHTLEELKVFAKIVGIPCGGIPKKQLVSKLDMFIPAYLELHELTVDELKYLCKMYDLTGYSSKNRDELINMVERVGRIRAPLFHADADTLEKMSIKELKLICRRRGLSMTGNKTSLVQRLAPIKIEQMCMGLRL